MCNSGSTTWFWFAAVTVCLLRRKVLELIERPSKSILFSHYNQGLETPAHTYPHPPKKEKNQWFLLQRNTSAQSNTILNCSYLVLCMNFLTFGYLFDANSICQCFSSNNLKPIKSPKPVTSWTILQTHV